VWAIILKYWSVAVLSWSSQLILAHQCTCSGSWKVVFGFVSDELGGGRDVTWGVHCYCSHHSWCWMFEGIVGRLCQLGHPFILTNCVSHLYQVNREGYSSIEQGSYHHC